MEVVAAVIQKDDYFLLCQRPKGKSMENHWEFPGGKVEPGETNEEALVRECKEELDVQLMVKKPLTTIIRELNGKELILHFYLCSVENGFPKKLEHQDFAWVKKDELSAFDLCPSDRAFVEWFTKESA